VNPYTWASPPLDNEAPFQRDGAAGSADETAATIRSYVDAGADRIYLQVLDLADLDHLDFIAHEVAPLLA